MNGRLAGMMIGMLIGLMASHNAPAQNRYSYQPQQSTYIPKAPDAPEHLKHLSPRCSSMNDAIRTGPTRGLTNETLSNLQKEYRRECAEEESEALRKLATERSDARKAKQEEKQAATEQRQRTELAQQQCDESKRILYNKKRRTDLTDGEKADLQRFEEAYRSRCN